MESISLYLYHRSNGKFPFHCICIEHRFDTKVFIYLEQRCNVNSDACCFHICLMLLYGAWLWMSLNSGSSSIWWEGRNSKGSHHECELDGWSQSNWWCHHGQVFKLVEKAPGGPFYVPAQSQVMRKHVIYLVNFRG